MIDKKKKIAWWLNDSRADTDIVNAQNQEAWLFNGHSFIFGNNNMGGPGTAPAAGTAYQWDNVSSVIEIGATDIVTCPEGQGTFIPKLCSNYYNGTGRKIVAICQGHGGSTFYSNAGSNTWFSTGTHRGDSEEAVEGTLEAIGTTRLRYVVSAIGVNDMKSVIALSTVYDAIDDYVEWCNTAFPGVPKLFLLDGRDDVSAFSSRHYGIRNKLLSICYANEDCHIVWNWGKLYGSRTFGADDLHPSWANNESAADGIYRWVANPTLHKWARTHVACLGADISTTRKQLLNTFYTNQVSNGNYSKLETLAVLKTNTDGDQNLDMSHLAYFLNGTVSGTFTQNDCVTTNGSTQFFTFLYRNDVNLRATTSDFIVGVWIKSVGTITGSDRVFGNQAWAFGANSGGPNLVWDANSTSADDTDNSPDTTPQANTIYAIARNGSDEYLYKDKTVIDSRTGTAAASTGTSPALGARNNSGTIDLYLSGSYYAVFAAKYSDFDYDSFVDDLKNLVDNW